MAKEDEEAVGKENGDVLSPPGSPGQDPANPLQTQVRDSMASNVSDAPSQTDLQDKPTSATSDDGQDAPDKPEDISNLKGKKHSKNISPCCQLPDDGRLISGMYAAIMVLLGVVFPVSEALRGEWLTEIPSGVFLVYLFGMSVISILVLEVILLRQSRKQHKEMEELKANELAKDEPKPARPVSGYTNTSFDGELVIVKGKSPALSMSDISHMSQKAAPSDIERGEHYVIDSGNEWEASMPHHTSLYLRIGAVVFGLGSLIYVGLLLKQHHEGGSPAACSSAGSLVWPYYVLLAFLLAQTYFIIKHGQLNVVTCLPEARLCLVHLLVTNWCVWTRTLTREIVDTLIRNHTLNESPSSPSSSLTLGVTSNMTTIPPEVSTVPTSCSFADNILHRASPYLFPCVLEYSILAAAQMYSMFADIGYILRQQGEQSSDDVIHNAPLSPSWMEINFHKTHKGLFLGIVVFAATCVSIILFFSYLGTSGDNVVPMFIYHVSDLGLHAILIGACITGWLQIRKLSFWRMHDMSVSHWLLIIATCGLLLYHMFKAYGTFLAIGHGVKDVVSILNLIGSILSMVLAVFQSSFIIDALSRRTTTIKNLQNKPGRGSVTFLLLGNVAMWAFRTLQLKEAEIEDSYEQGIFGFLAWKIIVHALVPLLVFYYYIASACLAQVWGEAYRRDTLTEALPDPPKEDEEGEGDPREWSAYDGPDHAPVRVIELRRRVKKGNHLVQEVETILSPVSEV